MDVKEALIGVDEVLNAADAIIKRLVIARNILEDVRNAHLTDLRPKKQAFTLLSLPPEIRNMIYRYALVSSRPMFRSCRALRSLNVTLACCHSESIC